MAKNNEKGVSPILPKSKELESLLGIAYHMDAKKAQMIKEDWEKNGSTSKFPYDKYEAAEAFLEAFNSKAEVVSKRQPWKREKK